MSTTMDQIHHIRDMLFSNKLTNFLSPIDNQKLFVYILFNN